MTMLLNLLWFVLGGWVSALLWILAGVLLAVTIIGLPWAPSAFRIAAFTAFPFGRIVVQRGGHPDQDLVLNVVWLVLAGWWLALHHVLLAVLLGVTVIGIPFAIQHIKLAGISLAPVGKTIIDA